MLCTRRRHPPPRQHSGLIWYRHWLLSIGASVHQDTSRLQSQCRWYALCRCVLAKELVCLCCAYSHYVSGQSGLPFVNEIDKNRKVDFWTFFVPRCLLLRRNPSWIGWCWLQTCIRNKDDDANRLRPSEVGWQSRLVGASGDRVRPSRLRCIVMHFILNENTTGTYFWSFILPVCTITSVMKHSLLWTRNPRTRTRFSTLKLTRHWKNKYWLRDREQT